MSNYTKTTNFATKDALASGNPAKIVKGTEIDTEFNNIAVASGTKADKASPVFTGTVTLPATNADSLSIGGDGVTVTGIKDEDDMASNSATKLASQQSIKAYVDSQVTAQDLDVTDGTTSISIDLDSEALSLLGGTGVTSTASGNGVTMAIDSTVATLTGSQTLTNKTLTTPVISGNLTTDGNIDGRDVATDGTKLDTVETNADVTDTVNVTAAGALMDSEVTNLAEVKAFDSTDYATAAQGTTADAALPKAGGAMTGAITTNSTFDGRDVATDGTKLDGIEALADVTDATNVTAAGALMDSELTSIASVKALNQGVATGDSPSFVGLTASGEITANGGIALGDNDKATFGASDDLQIYHDGNNSYIDESATGSLLIRGSNLQLRSYGTNEYFFTGVENGASTIYYDGLNKLATTSTGIDVTGTATMDGLTVNSGAGDQVALFESTDQFADLALKDSGGTSHIRQSNGSLLLQADRANASASSIVQISVDGSQVARFATGGDISFYEDTGTTAKLFWDASAESLGIGTTSPSSGYILDARGWANFQHPTGDSLVKIQTGNNTGTSLLYFSDSDSVFSGSIAYLHTDDAMRFNTNAAERMRIDSSGNVGIGTSSPSYKLSVSGNIGLTDGVSTASHALVGGNYYIQNTGAYSTIFQTNAAERMRIDASGNLLVGTTDTTIYNHTTGEGVVIGPNAIQISRSSDQMLLLNRMTNSGPVAGFYAAGVGVGSIAVTGSATSYLTSSDQRLKENIADADDAGSKIDAIQVRKYDWKADGSHQDYGMIAQELQTVAPEAVSGDADSEEMMGVDYSKLVPMLIKEIQSLRNRVAQLEE